ncbi:MAG: hybrid sensor histidine kinase/response regulator [Bacteroidota bacterium]
MDNSLINVLYLDDELHNLQSFRATFRKQYNIYTTDSIEEAEAILDNNSIHVLLADQRMPVMTGVQFFEKIRKKHGDVIRILITGHTDISAAIDAINKGEVFRFIDKPWDYTYVQNAIAHGFDIYKTKTELAQRNEDLQKAYDELDKFVYSASHDLRAPLMSVIGVVTLALMEDKVTSQNEYLGLIKQSVLKLDAFILSIIDYYKNARGVPVIQPINFNELAVDVKETIMYFPGFDKIDHRIIVNQEGIFKSDIIKLRIILNNLLSNAVKFQDPKKEAHNFTLEINASENGCKILISDNGLGIKEKDIENVFKMFYRGGNAASGSGIGLYIVNEAIYKLGGKISVHSVYGEGATFEITLPSINE